MIYDAVFVVWVWKLYLAILNNGSAAIIDKTGKTKGYLYLKVEIFLRTVSSIDLISLKMQILGGKVLFKNPRFKSQWGRVKFFAIFLYFFHFVHKKLNIKTYTTFFVLTGYIEIR